MKARVRNSAKRAFTLVEILIVVVILGILAAIVIPQFTNASQEASRSSIESTLQTVRSQIELYRVKENGVVPDLITNGWDPLTIDNAAADQYDLLQAPPVNPLTGTSTVAADTTGAWQFDVATGEIFATNPDGIDFDGDGVAEPNPLPW